MNIMVTGGKGFIGSNLVNRLTQAGHKVEVFDLADGHDLRDLTQVWDAVQRKQAVFHLAAIADLNWARVHPIETMDINVKGTWNVAYSCMKAGAALYFASTCCFPAGTAIQTEDGIKTIDQINAGDTVISHTGEPRRVLRTGKRYYQGTIHRIHSLGNIPVHATPEHPFLASSPGGERIWKQAKDLRVGDRLVSPSRKSLRPEASTPAKAYLLGLFVAEGSLADDEHHRSITFHFGDEPQLLEAVGAGMQQLYNKTSHNRSCSYLNQKGIRSTFYGKDLLPEFSVCYSSPEHRAFTKSIPIDIYCSSDDASKIGFLRGFIDGDGCFYHSHKTGNLVTMATVSPTLAWQLRQMMIDIGIFPAMSTRVPCTSIQGRPVNARKSFILQVRGTDAGKLLSLFGWEGHQYTTKPRQKYSWEKKDVVTPIYRLDQEEFRGDVYNIEVETDNSYIANGVAVHNCVYGNQDTHPVDETTLPRPAEIYAGSKLACEGVLRGFHCSYGLQYNAMRFATIYGEGTRPALATHIFLGQALRGEPITVHGNGKQTRTLTHVRDLVDGIMALFKSEKMNDIWNLTTEEEVSALQMAKDIKMITGSASPITFIPQRTGQTMRESVSARKMLEETGWKAEVKWEDGIRSMTEWFRATGQVNNRYQVPGATVPVMAGNK